MEPKDQSKADKQQDDRKVLSICLSDGGIENVDWIKYAAARRLGVVPREGESMGDALRRWQAEHARQQSDDEPVEADDGHSTKPNDSA